MGEQVGLSPVWLIVIDDWLRRVRTAITESSHSANIKRSTLELKKNDRIALPDSIAEMVTLYDTFLFMWLLFVIYFRSINLRVFVKRLKR